MYPRISEIEKVQQWLEVHQGFILVYYLHSCLDQSSIIPPKKNEKLTGKRGLNRTIGDYDSSCSLPSLSQLMLFNIADIELISIVAGGRLIVTASLFRTSGTLLKCKLLTLSSASSRTVNSFLIYHIYFSSKSTRYDSNRPIDPLMQNLQQCLSRFQTLSSPSPFSHIEQVCLNAICQSEATDLSLPNSEDKADLYLKRCISDCETLLEQFKSLESAFLSRFGCGNKMKFFKKAIQPVSNLNLWLEDLWCNYVNGPQSLKRAHCERVLLYQQ
jgi:hypothetical protein